MKILVEGSHADAHNSPSEQSKLVARARLVDAAKSELARRRRRTELFPEGTFGEPGWEILLLLYAEDQGTRLNVARICDNLHLPVATTLRWLNYLQDKELVRREKHPTDQRSVLLRLTDKAISKLDEYLSERLAVAG
jgi:DNA-binding MarR family transcriptional regulator